MLTDRAIINSRYNAMARRHYKVFGIPLVRKLMKYRLFREIMFYFFGKPEDTMQWIEYLNEVVTGDIDGD